MVHSGSIHYFHSIYRPMTNKNIDTYKHITWRMTNTYQQVLCHQYHQSIFRPSKTQLDCLCSVIAMVTVCQQQFDKEGGDTRQGKLEAQPAIVTSQTKTLQRQYSWLFLFLGLNDCTTYLFKNKKKIWSCCTTFDFLPPKDMHDQKCTNKYWRSIWHKQVQVTFLLLLRCHA